MPVLRLGLLLDCFNKVSPLFSFYFFLSFTIILVPLSTYTSFYFFLKSAFLNYWLYFKSFNLNFYFYGLFSPRLFLCFNVVEFMLVVLPKLIEGMLLVEKDFFSKLLIEWNLLKDVSFYVLLSLDRSVSRPNFPGLPKAMILPTLIFFIVRSW